MADIEQGYDEQMGARPMARVIQEHIKKPLADVVLFGVLKSGGHVRVVVAKDEEIGRDKLSVEMGSKSISAIAVWLARRPLCRGPRSTSDL